VKSWQSECSTRGLTAFGVVEVQVETWKVKGRRGMFKASLVQIGRTGLRQDQTNQIKFIPVVSKFCRQLSTLPLRTTLCFIRSLINQIMLRSNLLLERPAQTLAMAKPLQWRFNKCLTQSLHGLAVWTSNCAAERESPIRRSSYFISSSLTSCVFH
jgi:hypothetical protein